MRKLSVAIITFNEESNIARALKSVSFADEIVVVDSHSTDKTVEICKEFGATVTLREFAGHVDQKNFALGLTEHDWVLSLDADEVITDGLKDEIIQVLNADNIKDGYKMPRLAFYLGRWIKHSGWYPDYKTRLVNKTKAKWVGIDPSDRLELDGALGTFKNDFLHYTYQDVAHHLRTINSYTSITAERLFEKGKKTCVLDLTVRPFLVLIKKYFLKLGFLDGIPGLVIAITTAFYTFSKYLKLRELWIKKENS